MRETGLAQESFQQRSPIGDSIKQTCQRLMVTTQPAVQEPEQLRQGYELPLGQHILEDTVPRPEHNTSALLEHRLAHKPERTPQVHNTKEPSVHRREHKLQREQHS